MEYISDLERGFASEGAKSQGAKSHEHDVMGLVTAEADISQLTIVSSQGVRIRIPLLLSLAH